MSTREAKDYSHFFFVPLTHKSRDILNTTVRSAPRNIHSFDTDVSCGVSPCGGIASVPPALVQVHVNHADEQHVNIPVVLQFVQATPHEAATAENPPPVPPAVVAALSRSAA